MRDETAEVLMLFTLSSCSICEEASSLMSRKGVGPIIKCSNAFAPSAKCACFIDVREMSEAGSTRSHSGKSPSEPNHESRSVQ